MKLKLSFGNEESSGDETPIINIKVSVNKEEEDDNDDEKIYNRYQQNR